MVRERMGKSSFKCEELSIGVLYRATIDPEIPGSQTELLLLSKRSETPAVFIPNTTASLGALHKQLDAIRTFLHPHSELYATLRAHHTFQKMCTPLGSGQSTTPIDRAEDGELIFYNVPEQLSEFVAALRNNNLPHTHARKKDLPVGEIVTIAVSAQE